MKWLPVLLLAAQALARSPSEQRGRAIYFGGASASGRSITAIVGGAAELPASSLPCGSCHGPDGAGVAEGTITPADIRSSVLSQPRLTGRLRPRYDDAALGRAITHGVDAAGNALSPIMPRYRMHEGDLADLAAYLRRLGDPAQPGLTNAEITVGSSVQGPAAEVTHAMLAAFANDLNASGGIYGRRLRVEQSVDADRTFAIVCATEVALDEHDRVPLITPFPIVAPAESSFFLYPDLETQAVALLQSIDAPRKISVEHDGSAEARAAASVLGTPSAEATHLFVLGNVDVSAILRRLDGASRTPHILIAGAAVTRELLDSGRNITMAMPALPGDVSADGHRELEDFLARHGLPRTQMPTRIATYAAMKVFLEGLKRSGRDVTREKLIAALERLYEFPTGLTRPITFSRSRHIGSPGAHVVSLDAR